MNEPWRQSPEWEELFQTCINKAKRCPANALCFNNLITAEKVDDAAGNHVFDDYPEFWEITENQGHQIRAVFQHYSVRNDPGFKKYITDLIDNSWEVELRKTRSKSQP
jgi:hypothetical protein